MLVDEIIEKYPQTISTLVNIEQMENILKNFYSVKDIPGDVVELACNIGTTSIYIKRMIDALNLSKIFHVYDSFKGLPEPSEVDGNLCKKGDMQKDRKDFEGTFRQAGVKIPVIHEGWFAEIPDNEYPEKISFAFFDGDFYSSIIDSFNKVYHKMQPGGIILVHDYEGEMLPGVKVACNEFLSDKPEKVIDIYWGIAKIIKE